MSTCVGGAIVFSTVCTLSLTSTHNDGITLLGGCFRGYTHMGLGERNYINYPPTYEGSGVIADWPPAIAPARGR